MSDLDFSHEDVERARRYHRPLYLAFAVELAPRRRRLLAPRVELARRPALGRRRRARLGGRGRRVGGARARRRGARPAAARRLARARARAALGLLDADRRGVGGRPGEGARDRGSSLGTGVWVAAVALGRALPGWWALPAAAALALLTLFLAFVAPVVLEPLFNRFEPLADARARGRAPRSSPSTPACRSATCSSPTRASARRRSNAYVSGLGATRRVVLWDTLLAVGGRARGEARRSRTSSATAASGTPRSSPLLFVGRRRASACSSSGPCSGRVVAARLPAGASPLHRALARSGCRS